MFLTRGFHQFCALLLTGVLALSLSACASSKKKDEAALHARVGAGLLHQGRYPEALRELLIAENLDPKNAQIQNNLGLAYFMRERFKTAAEKLHNAVELDPKYSEARNNYARVLIELEQYEAAIRELKVVINDLTYTDPSKAYVNMGLAYFRKSDFEEARTIFAKAIKISRENCLAQTFYGRSLFELAKFAQAASALDNAALVCKDSAFDEPQYFSGLAYYKLGRTSSAISRMEDVLRLYPDGKYAKKAEDLLKLMK